jgi:hypothetical protein
MLTFGYFIKDFNYIGFDFGANIANTSSFAAANGNTVAFNSNGYSFGLNYFKEEWDLSPAAFLNNLLNTDGYYVYYETGDFNLTDNFTLVNESYDYYRIQLGLTKGQVISIGNHIQIKLLLIGFGVGYSEYNKVITGNILQDKELVNRKITNLSYGFIAFPGTRITVRISPSKKK